MDPRQVSDEVEIAALLNSYARAVDTKDWELYRSVFTDDAHIDYSASGVVAGSVDEVVDFFRGDFSALVTMSMHYITNIESDIDGETARVRAMFGWRRTGDQHGRSRHLREERVWTANSPREGQA